MNEYMAEQIISGGLSYTALFTIEKWKRYQESVNQILIDKGKSELIVKNEQ